MTVIDGSNLVLGRASSILAKRPLKGERIQIVNAEAMVVTGTKQNVMEKLDKRREGTVKGNPHKGPKYPRMPERIVKRSVRGMLPWKKPKGKAAFKNLRVYISVPSNLIDVKAEKIDGAVNRLEKGFLTVGDISRNLGAKW